MIQSPHRARCCAIIGLAMILTCLVGCKQPCEQLGDQLCRYLEQHKELCDIAMAEAKRKDVTYRRCRALSATIKNEGRTHLQAYAKRYVTYRNWVGRQFKMDKGLQLMAAEHKRFRQLIQRLLQLPATQKTHAKPAPRKRKKAKKRRRQKPKKRRNSKR